MGSEVVKPNVKKVRRIGKDVIAGFAGSFVAAECVLVECMSTKACQMHLSSKFSSQ